MQTTTRARSRVRRGALSRVTRARTSSVEPGPSAIALTTSVFDELRREVESHSLKSPHFCWTRAAAAVSMARTRLTGVCRKQHTRNTSTRASACSSSGTVVVVVVVSTMAGAQPPQPPHRTRPRRRATIPPDEARRRSGRRGSRRSVGRSIERNERAERCCDSGWVFVCLSSTKHEARGSGRQKRRQQNDDERTRAAWRPRGGHGGDSNRRCLSRRRGGAHTASRGARVMTRPSPVRCCLVDVDRGLGRRRERREAREALKDDDDLGERVVPFAVPENYKFYTSSGVPRVHIDATTTTTTTAAAAARDPADVERPPAVVSSR